MKYIIEIVQTEKSMRADQIKICLFFSNKRIYLLI